jgi:hypothetical protein
MFGKQTHDVGQRGRRGSSDHRLVGLGLEDFGNRGLFEQELTNGTPRWRSNGKWLRLSGSLGCALLHRRLFLLELVARRRDVLFHWTWAARSSERLEQVRIENRKIS